MFYVYILESVLDSTLYVGQSKNVESRLMDHNDGRSRSTASKRPWKLVYTEKYSTRAEAMKREKYLKSLKSRVALYKIIKKQDL